MAADSQNALGLVETRGLVAAIEAADAMSKASQVKLVGIENTIAALMTVQITGDTAAVRSAVDAGVRAASKVGDVLSSHVIPRPSSAVAALQSVGPTSDGGRPSTRAADRDVPLEDMTVRELRKLARATPGLSIQGREIASANKSMLLKVLGAAGL